MVKEKPCKNTQRTTFADLLTIIHNITQDYPPNCIQQGHRKVKQCSPPLFTFYRFLEMFLIKTYVLCTDRACS